MSSTDVLIYVDVISNKQSIFSRQIRTPSFPINWPSLVSTARSTIILWRLWSHKPLHRHDSNKYQFKAFVICDHKSDETRSVTHVNKAYLVWLMFWVLGNQHYQHRASLPTNAVFQNCGVCGKAFPSFPSPVTLFFFLLSSQFSRQTHAETLATQANLFDILVHFIGKTAEAEELINQSHLMVTSISIGLFFCFCSHCQQSGFHGIIRKQSNKKKWKRKDDVLFAILEVKKAIIGYGKIPKISPSMYKPLQI